MSQFSTRNRTSSHKPASFTPGPWIVTDIESAVGDMLIASNAKGKRDGENIGHAYVTHPVDVGRANARLIAKSPALLAMLKEVAVDYRACGMEKRQIMTEIQTLITQVEGA